MRTIDHRVLVTIVALLLLGCGSGGSSDDTTVDDPSTDSVADPVGDDPGDVPGETTEDTGGDPDVGDPSSDTDVEDGLEEEPAAVCGNGTVEGDEICDDGNDVTEDCDTTDPTACLADCSLRMATCGDGAPDPGEQCDDGNLDEYDGCTSSCTINEGSIGSPCRCVSGCETFNFAAGEIEGCDAVEGLADSSREVACIYSSSDDTFGIETYAPGGYCSLMALGCEGLMCVVAPEVGDVDTFTCPEGYAVITVVEEVTGLTLTMKLCQQTCETDADCRWNEVEVLDVPWTGTCGQYACDTLASTGERVCADARNPRPEEG